MTVKLAVVAMPLAIAIGLGVAVMRMYGPRLFGRLLGLYVEVIRGTPLVLQLYVIFFLLPEAGVSMDAFCL
jgi:His/Glu/Gln/Arg/opine family amino acid ABC transporter permease subunit